MIVRELVATLGLDFIGEGFEKAEKAFESIHAKAGGIIAIFAGAGAALTGVTLEVAEQAEKLKIMSETLGVSTDDLQKLGYAAKMSDVGMEEFGNSLRFLQRNLGQAAKGNKELQAEFEHLGGSVDPATGRVRSAKDVLYSLADRMKATKDPAERVRLAITLLGRAGAQMVPVLSKGREALKELGDEALDSGYVLSKEFVESSKEFEDTLKQSRALLTGLAHTLAVAFLPTLNKVVTGFRDWYKAHQQTINAIAAGSVRVVAAVFTLLGQAIGLVAFGVEKLLKASGPLRPMLTLLAVAAIALGAAFASPIAAVFALSAAVGLAIDDLETFARGGQSVTGRIVDSFKEMGPKISDSLASIETSWASFTDSISNSDFILGLQGRWIEYGDTVMGVVAQIKNSTGFGWVPGLTKLREDIEATVWAFQKLYDLVVNHADAFKKAFDLMFPGVGLVAGGVHDVGKIIGSDATRAGLVQGARTMVSPLTSLAGGVVGGVKGLGDWISGGAPIARAHQVTNNITVHAAPGMDEEKLAELTAKKIAEQNASEYQSTYSAMTPGVP